MKPKILIHIEGGMIQKITSTQEVVCIVADRDLFNHSDNPVYEVNSTVTGELNTVKVLNQSDKEFSRKIDKFLKENL